MNNICNQLLDTVNHIDKVKYFIEEVIHRLLSRSRLHDKSKFYEPELSGYADMVGELKGVRFGTTEYKSVIDKHKGVVEHHYEHNDHHPEHFTEGVNSMNLIQLTEMLCDWKAASLRIPDSSLMDTLDAQIARFGIQPQLANVLRNTIVHMDW